MVFRDGAIERDHQRGPDLTGSWLSLHIPDPVNTQLSSSEEPQDMKGHASILARTPVSGCEAASVV